MPSKFSWSKSNRSHSSVDTSSGHPSPVPSVSNEGAAQQQQQQQSLAPNQQPLLQQVPEGEAQTAYRQHQFPLRATSHRHSAHLSLEQPPQNIHSPQPSPGIDQQRRGSHQPQSTPYVVQQQESQQKRSLRSRIPGLKGHSKDGDDQRHASKNGLGRRVSVRKSDGQPADNVNYQAPDRLQAAKWNQRQGSSPHLPTSNEQDEDDLDPFLQQEDHDTPQPPPKDIAYQQQLHSQHGQQFAPNNPHQQQYGRPPLVSVDTGGSYRTEGGVSHYSPDQHQGLPTQQPPPQQQYQSYPPPVQHSQSADSYQAFNPQSTPSPHPNNVNIQLQSQDLTQQQQHQNYIAYQQQPQQQQHQGQQIQQLQQHSPQDIQQPSVHYQQQQYSPPPQPHPSQDFPPQNVQHGRPPSQHQLEVQHPQPTHQIPQIVQQGQQIDPQQLQQFRPPSAHQQLAPPSPLQQPPQYQAYDAQQQGHPSQTADTHSLNITPPQQGQETMAPPGGQQRNTLRKVNEAGAPPSAAPSRESSMLQQPPAQGQPHGHPPVSPIPGVTTFGANVVPTASQGQPFRGEKQAEDGEMGRATPPPRSARDMSDSDVEKMAKELEVLREKYQKVKRYFFEQQSQVHQLQNTIANQRLSLSRTSWDDSEYATRFNRLDGLIAQLSFAIRKDWKSIPPWLQTVVNKNAVETGKQEMTAVGRAFISAWLVENIFDKYFHPDLDPGLSTQLKTIQLNIRKFSPATSTTEDEEALVSKTVNWRLATLEGLAEVLKAPQSHANRQSLIETLNQSLIGSLQMYLNDPAPPDLNGGVPMIVELAVNVAQHLPLESREVHIEYFPPGHGLVSEFMKMETGIPALTNPILDHEDAASMRSVASKVDDTSSIAEQDQQQQPQQTSQAPKEVADKKRGMFSFGGGSKKPATLGKRESSLGQGGSQQSLGQGQAQGPPGSSSGGGNEPPPPRVRMAVGVAVQIRGKSILIKAPVYST